VRARPHAAQVQAAVPRGDVAPVRLLDAAPAQDAALVRPADAVQVPRQDAVPLVARALRDAVVAVRHAAASVRANAPLAAVRAALVPARPQERAARRVVPRDRDAVPVPRGSAHAALAHFHAAVLRSDVAVVARPAHVGAVAPGRHAAAHSAVRLVADPHARRSAAVSRLAAALDAGRGCVARAHCGRLTGWARPASLRARAGSAVPDAARDWHSPPAPGGRSDARRVARRSARGRVRYSEQRRAAAFAQLCWRLRWAVRDCSAPQRCAALGSCPAQLRYRPAHSRGSGERPRQRDAGQAPSALFAARVPGACSP